MKAIVIFLKLGGRMFQKKSNLEVLYMYLLKNENIIKLYRNPNT